jgi:hypothetical protein
MLVGTAEAKDRMEQELSEQRLMIIDQGRQIDEMRQAASNAPFSEPGGTRQMARDGLAGAYADPTNLREQPHLPTTLMETTIPSATSWYDGTFSMPLPEDLVVDLIKMFLKHIRPWAPILLDEQALYARPWSTPVKAIVVISIRFSSDPRLAGIKEQVRSAARSSVIIDATTSTTFSSIQGLAILALDLIGSGQGPDAWAIIGLLCRSAVHLGLSMEEDNVLSTKYTSTAPVPGLRRTRVASPANTWKEDESRRRLFWLIFCLDRFTCVTTGWEFALPNYDIIRRLPCWDNEWENLVNALNARRSKLILFRHIAIRQCFDPHVITSRM